MRHEARPSRILAVSLAFAALAFGNNSAAAAEDIRVDGAGVVVADPSVLPPPGHGFGWVDHPCSHEVLFRPDWIVNGEEFNQVFAQAHDAILTDIGTPTLQTDGADVVSTFSATLNLDATVVVGFPSNPPTALSLPGTITARFFGKAGKTTGTFLMRMESMSFQATLYGLQVAARQDPGRDSLGSISVTDLGNGTYRVASELDAYTQVTLYGSTLKPPDWLSYTSDLNAPIHFELVAAACPSASLPVAGFSVSPTAPAAGQNVPLTDTSTGSPTSWSWDFGDGTSSSAHDPVHAWAAAGTYVVRLTATNAYGSDSFAEPVPVGGGGGFTSPGWLPVASHTSGANNSQWRSDLGILVPGGAPAHVQVNLYTPGGVKSSTATVPAHAQAILADVVSQLGFTGSGAIQVTSDQPVIATSRTYNKSGNGTFGQDYASSSSTTGLNAGDTAWLPQLTENASYRSNISVTNTGPGPADATVTLFDGAGNQLGSYDVSLAPGGWQQVTQPFKNKATPSQTAMAAGYAKITVNSGSGVVATASVIDNSTNDPTTFAATR